MLRFENLGEASADWQGRALSELLKRRFSAERMPRAASPAPGISTERLAAIAAGATRLITGYYISNGEKLEVTAITEDVTTQKLSIATHVSGNLPAVVTALAQQFGADKTSEINASSPALREYALATDGAGAASIPHYELAIQADPNFAPAYIGILQTGVAQTEPAKAQQIAADALKHSASFGKEDRAYLQLETATMARDNRARVDALASVSALNVNDADALRALADAEMTTRKPAQAAQHYKQAIAIKPNDPNLRNLLAYAALYAGDEAEARAAALEYRRLQPQDPNARDTAGDVELAFGHFAEAERDYAATPWKAARARLLTGDEPGASAILAKQPKTPASGYRAAEWLYLTGHREEGTKAMAEFAATSDQAELRSAAYAQAAIWAMLSRDNVHANEWSEQALKLTQRSTFVYAAVARFLAQPAADPNRVFSGPNAAEVRRLAVALRLLLSRSFTLASPLWKQIYESTNVVEAAPMYLYGWTLLETGHKEEAAALLKLNPIPSARIAPSLEALYLPNLFEWRKASLRQ